MKLEVGMYVRHKPLFGFGDVKIHKIKQIEESDNLYIVILRNGSFISNKNIISASFDVIDVIEKGDYVNGMLVVGIENDNSDEKYIQCGYISKSQDVWVTTTYYSEEIENIVIKEQFKAMEYKIEEYIYGKKK